MSRAVSSQVVAPHSTTPRSGRNSPATICSTVVLPAPDGPGEREALAVADLERDVEPGARGLELNPQHGTPA